MVEAGIDGNVKKSATGIETLDATTLVLLVGTSVTVIVHTTYSFPDLAVLLQIKATLFFGNIRQRFLERSDPFHVFSFTTGVREESDAEDASTSG